MRITSGIYRGRTLATPDTTLTHPMGDREKLALFNRIAPYLPASRVLDLYCGSGALGLESLSRGALSAVFVDMNDKALRTVRTNIKTLGVTSQTEVIKANVQHYLTEYQGTSTSEAKTFDVIFADPPYDHFSPEEFANVADWLKTDGIFVLSHPDATPNLQGLTLISTKSYAAAHLSIYRPD